MNFNERIDDYKILKQGEFIVYKGAMVCIDLIEDEIMTMQISFANDDGKKSYIQHELEGNILKMTYMNMDRDYYISGIFKPIEIGKIDNGDSLYFSCIVFTIDSKSGNRILKYSFLTK